MELSKLATPFPAEKVHWRVGATTKDKDKGIALAYIDARDVMERLDTVVGPGGWQCRYPFSGCCEIGILVEGEWVWKANGAGETDVEGEKGQYSDAFKRAAVLWGIGRYLYDLPNQWMPLKPQGRTHVLAQTPTLPVWALPPGSKDQAPEPPKPAQAAPEGSQKVGELELKKLRVLIEKTNTDEAVFCRFLKVENLEALPLSSFAGAESALIQKERALETKGESPAQAAMDVLKSNGDSQ